MFGRKKRKKREADLHRAEGMAVCSQLLGQIAESVKGSPRDDLAKGLLAAAGLTSVMAASVRTGTNEMSVIDLGDGDGFPIDLQMVMEKR